MYIKANELIINNIKGRNYVLGKNKVYQVLDDVGERLIKSGAADKVKSQPIPEENDLIKHQPIPNVEAQPVKVLIIQNCRFKDYATRDKPVAQYYNSYLIGDCVEIPRYQAREIIKSGCGVFWDNVFEIVKKLNASVLQKFDEEIEITTK